MNQLSKGLFAIPDEIANAYIATSRDHYGARNEVAAYRKMEIGLEGVQLVAARDEAQALGKFVEAADIQRAIADRSSQGRDIAVAYAAEGLSKKVITADSAFLEKMSADRSDRETEAAASDPMVEPRQPY